MLEVPVILVPHGAPPSRRWLAYLVRASEAVNARRERIHGAPPFDPVAVLALARRERVTPLLHLGYVNGRNPDALPDSFRAACEAAYYRTLHKNIVALKTGQRILAALRCAGISAAPLDGWAVLQGPLGYHADPGTRPLEDLELMVRESDKEWAECILVELGYRRITRRDAAIRSGHELAFRHNEAGADLFVELHWAWEASASPANRFAVSGDEFLDGLCDTTVTGYHRPTRFANLTVAAVRAARHTLGRWIWLADLHRIITAVSMDWGEVVSAARRWRVRAPLYASLVATRELFHTPIPRDVLERLAPGPVRRRLLHRSLAACQVKGGASRAARTARLLLGESWWEVARAAARTAAPGTGAHPGWRTSSGTQVRFSHPVRVVSPFAGDR
jgi:hypothetical protein